MVKKELSETEIAESIPDLWQPLTQEQREFLAQNFTIQKYKKNETIYCEGETPMHLMCLLSGKVKDGIRCGGSWVFEDGDGVSGFVDGVWMGGVLLLDVCEYFLLVHVGSLLFLIMNG